MLFRRLGEYFEKLETMSSRLLMVEVLTEMFKEAKASEISKIIYITQGVLAPPFEGIKFNLAEKIAEESIAIATGHSKEDVSKAYRKSGDMGITAMELQEKSRLKKMSNKEFTVSEFYDAMRKIAETSGAGSKDHKIKMLANVIAASTPTEAKYAVKYPLDELRMGVGDATVMEALAAAFLGDRKLKEKLEVAYNLCSDLGSVGEEVAEHGIKGIESFKVSLFKPIRPALAERLPTAEEIIEKMGGSASVEQKYDGFRCQIHKKSNKVRIFSRRLEDTTEMFPDLRDAMVNEIRAEEIILDGEALAYNEKTQQFLPFQETIQRKRKHRVDEKALEMPLKLFAFDIMYLEGKNLMDEPYKKRRELLEKVTSASDTIRPSTRIITSSPKELEEFFQTSIENGLEGIVAKEQNGKYVAGARKFGWIKMKRSYKGELEDTLDLVIIGYFLGKGQRSEFKFGGLLCAAYNEKRDMFESVSRIGSGFSEAQMVELKRALDKIIVKSRPARVDSIVEPDFWVIPKYVVTIKADEITKSPMHTCGKGLQKDGTEAGYALRFPRLVGNEAIRSDKSIEDATTTEEVIEMYNQQRKVSIGKEQE
jgi:DNA ligase-1